MQNFLIEFRLQGYAKKYARNLIYDVARKFNVKGVTRQRAVPHISLYGTASTNDLRKVISEVESVGKKYTLVPFKIKGFNYFSEPKKVIYLDIDPSPELRELRQELSTRLSKISASAKPFDREKDFSFHSTIAFQDIDRKFSHIWLYIKQKEKPDISQHLLRITILGKSSRILYEYDLVLGRLLNRRQALSGYWRRKSINRLRELQGLHKQKRQSRFTRLIQLFKTKSTKRSIYFIGDLHLDHAHIITLCQRPFANVHEMNKALISNWTHAIKADDTVYFLGDLTGPPHKCKPPKYWLPKLTGKIHWMRGNHDSEVKGLKEYEILEFGKYRFRIVHRPEDSPRQWDGWIIHGHKHNNSKNYPFINGEKKTINVSVELIDYRPVSLDFLLSLDLDSIMRMDTIKSKPERWKH